MAPYRIGTIFKQINLTNRLDPKKYYPTPAYRVDLGVRNKKEFSTLPRSLELEPYHRVKFSVYRTRFFMVGGDAEDILF